MELETVQLLKDSALVATIIISMILIVWLAFVLTKNDKMKVQIKKLKTWRKFAGIEARQLRSDMKQLQTELTEERAFNDTQGSMHVQLMLKYAHVQEESEKAKKDLKIAQTCLKAAKTEISELKTKLSRKNLKRDAKGRVLPKVEPERDWTQASKEELLAEAKRRYPVGTKVIPFNLSYMKGDPAATIIFKDDFNWMSSGELEGVCVCDGGGYVYVDGKWAKIITE